MARIRTIKPEFWTDEKIVQLPYQARLAFIGLWNFCDDEGRLMDEPDRIKMQVLPADDVNMEIVIDILVSSGLIERYENEESSVLVIKNFLEHQVISHPAKSKIKMGEYKRRAIPMAERSMDVLQAQMFMTQNVIFVGQMAVYGGPKKTMGSQVIGLRFLD